MDLLKKILAYIRKSYLEIWSLIGWLYWINVGVAFGVAAMLIKYEYPQAEYLFMEILLKYCFSLYVIYSLSGIILIILLNMIGKILANQLAKRRKKHDAVIAKQ